MKTEKYKVEYAGFWVRCMAQIFDIFILGIPIIFVVSIFFGFDWLFSKSTNWSADISNLILWTIIITSLWTNWRGMTPGKKLMGIRIVSFPDYQKLSYTKSIIRYLIGYTISGLILGLGFIMIAFRKDKRGLHDLIAKTCVIYNK
ncbi:MAG: RDD family protein [Candidatus Pacebacteria bacterium]|nr:RDD family protein [Candidatus Paceibacterota bacterium]